MTPTLAVLLGVDIPFSSIGCLISEFLDNYSKEEQLYFYYYNALHLVEKFRKKFSVNKIKAQGERETLKYVLNTDQRHLLKFIYLGLSDYYFWLTEAELDHKNFLESNATSYLSFEKAKQNYIRVAKNISKLLSDSLVKYDNDLILISLVLSTLVR